MKNTPRYISMIALLVMCLGVSSCADAAFTNQKPLRMQDEGGSTADINGIDCVGDAIECTASNGTGTIEVTASGGGGVDSGTVGYVPYYTSSSEVGPAGTIFWDSSNQRLGIGTVSPDYALHVATEAHFGGTGGLTVDSGGGLRTATTTGNTAVLQAYDLGQASYKNFGVMTVGNPPTFNLDGTTTISNDTVVLRTVPQTLTNKTLTTPVIAALSNSGNVQTFFTSTDTFVGRATTDTLTNKTLTSPRVGTAINDTSGNQLLGVTATASAVNSLNLANGAATSNPTLSVITGDTNRGLTLAMAGTGGVTVSSSNTGPSTISRGLTVNSGANTGSGANFQVKGSGNSNLLYVSSDAGLLGIGTPPTTGFVHIDKGTGVGQVTIDGSTGGCLMIRDTDDAGWTECDVLDGTMSCGTDSDGLCD